MSGILPFLAHISLIVAVDGEDWNRPGRDIRINNPIQVLTEEIPSLKLPNCGFVYRLNRGGFPPLFVCHGRLLDRQPRLKAKAETRASRGISTAGTHTGLHGEDVVDATSQTESDSVLVLVVAKSNTHGKLLAR